MGWRRTSTNRPSWYRPHETADGTVEIFQVADRPFEIPERHVSIADDLDRVLEGWLREHRCGAHDDRRDMSAVKREESIDALALELRDSELGGGRHHVHRVGQSIRRPFRRPGLRRSCRA